MRTLAAAATAAAEAAWNADQVHEVGEVPDKPTFPYLVLSVTAPGDSNPRLGARSGSQYGWIVGQAVGRTQSEVAFAVEKADAAFLGKKLDVADLNTRPATRREPSTITRDPDAGGLLTCTLIYRFTTTPAPEGAPA